MSWPEAAALAVALIVIAVILIRAVLHGRGMRTATISPRMFFIRITFGIVLTLLGIVGAFLPILQGWVFFLLAAVVFFPNSKFAVKALDKAQPKMPRVVARLRSWGLGVERAQEE
jgi:hypothetical protein